MKGILVCLLGLSLMLNAYLWLALDAKRREQQETPQSSLKTPSVETVRVLREKAVPHHLTEQRSTALTRLQMWFEENDPRFSSALSEALKANPDDWSLLYLEAQYIAREQPLNVAVIHYFDLLDNSPPSPIAKQLTQFIQQKLGHAIEQLQLAGDWETLARFLEPLYQYQPNNRRFILNLAEAYGQQEKFTLMESALATLDQNDAQANALRRAMYPTASPDIDEAVHPSPEPIDAQATVALARSGNHFLVPLSINRKKTQLLIDTGASITAVSAQVLRQLKTDAQYQSLGKFVINTAGGPVEAEMITVSRVKLGPYVLKDVAVTGLPDNVALDSDGLLGMNILKYFDFRIDQYNAALLLSRNE